MPPVPPAAALAVLTHNRWALPVLGHIAEHRGAKFVTLSRQLGVAAPSLRRALDRLVGLGLVARNPGYGHPMRPEYVLGPWGAEVHGPARELLAWLRADALEAELLKKWHLPVLVALAPQPVRFGAVRAALPGATPRAVTLALKGTGALGLVAREVEAAYPPVPRYALTPRAAPGRAPAASLAQALAAVPLP